MLCLLLCCCCCWLFWLLFAVTVTFILCCCLVVVTAVCFYSLHCFVVYALLFEAARKKVKRKDSKRYQRHDEFSLGVAAAVVVAMVDGGILRRAFR